MRPLALGIHQNLVYIYNEVPPNTSTSVGHLRRYDTTIGKALNIVNSGLSISKAQISADGQWVLFLSIPDPRGDTLHNALLQLVRMDGQGLQTLYCFPATNGSASSSIQFQWSVDQKSIVVSMETEDPSATYSTSQIFLLDVASGTTNQLFLDQHNPTYEYLVMTWLDTTHFYITRGGTQPGGGLPLTIYLVNASTATVAHPGLQTVLSSPASSALTLDSSYDSTKLFTATSMTQSVGTIAVEPATGGTSQVIASSGNSCAVTLRVVTTNTLLLLVEVSGGASYQVWTMHTDGSGKRVLNTLSGSETENLNDTSQLPWSNVSRNGASYALQQGPSANRQSILIGSLSGGNTIVVFTASNTSSGLDLVGWTTM